MSGPIALIQSWGDIKADFSVNWVIYASMPIVAAIIGYVTKLLALEMLYRPLEFKGIGPIGWQGIVPARAGKVAATTIELLTENVLKPEEILDKIDVNQALDELREPLTRTIIVIAREFVEQLRPGLWDSLPQRGRVAIVARIESQAPGIVDRVLTEVRSDMGRYIDLQYIAVTTLVRNKAKLNNLMKQTAGSAMAFIRRSGVIFGFGIGLVQLACWALIHQVWIMPVFGFATGFLSDYIALNMLFLPRTPRKALGIFPIQGVLHQKRDEITRDYAKIMATDLFAPTVLFEALLNGPSADDLFAAIQHEISAAVDGQVWKPAKPIVTLMIGTARYRAAKERIFTTLLERLPETMAQAHDYTVRALDIENMIAEKMSLLSTAEFESIMRPVFKDDEWLMVTVGAVLGGLVGELQVQVVEHLSKEPHAAHAAALQVAQHWLTGR